MSSTCAFDETLEDMSVKQTLDVRREPAAPAGASHMFVK